MTGNKKNQNTQFNELFGVLIEEFGPMLANASEQFLNSRFQQSSDAAREGANGTKASQTSQTSHTSETSETSGTSTENQSHDEPHDDTDRSNHDAADSRKQNIKPEHTDDAAYKDTDAFEQQKTGRVRKTVRILATNGDVLGAMKDLIAEAGEVRKFEEVQRTQRTDIAARRDIAIANIEAQRAAIQTYLDKSFDERRENFSKLFNVVDHALDTNNMQELAISLQGVLTLAQSSPFKDLQTVEATATALADPDHEWDF